ncbi:MAG: hypothetical protein ACKOOF_07135 [Planctomycetaceae bacterium]
MTRLRAVCVGGIIAVAAVGGVAVAEPPPVPLIVPPDEQIEQQQQLQMAKQIEQMLQPALHAELEFIRRTCGDLEPETKRAITAAAADAVREAAAEFAAQQRTGRPSLDLGRIFAERLDPVVEQRAPPDGVVVWRRERDARRERQAEAARLLILAKLDNVLELTAVQREAIQAALRDRWDDAWLCELRDPGGFVVNGHRPAPDYAAAAITPHLDDRQQLAWAAWVRAAGWRQAGAGRHLGWRFPDGPGLSVPDPWWGE